MSLPTLSPREAKRLLDEGAVLVDVRERDEHARERIPGARHLALSALDGAALEAGPGRAVLFHCRSGMRTRGAAERLARAAGEGCEAYVVEGGLDAWRAAGLPTIRDAAQPLELQRQVQIVVGAVAFLGALASLLVSPWFALAPLVVGAGLFVAGVTGFCGLARALVHAPWNRALRSAPPPPGAAAGAR